MEAKKRDGREPAGGVTLRAPYRSVYVSRPAVATLVLAGGAIGIGAFMLSPFAGAAVVGAAAVAGVRAWRWLNHTPPGLFPPDGGGAGIPAVVGAGPTGPREAGEAKAPPEV
jgi:hypothetical protein